MRHATWAVLTLHLCFGLASTGAEPPLKVCLVAGCWEYEADKSLASFQKHLEGLYNARCTLVKAAKRDDLPGLEALDTCDVALFFTRRLTIDGEQLERVKKYCTSGRPVVAVRPTCAGFQKWLEFDKLILGGNYHGHIGAGPTMKATIEPKARSHPVLRGVDSAGQVGYAVECPRGRP